MPRNYNGIPHVVAIFCRTIQEKLPASRTLRISIYYEQPRTDGRPRLVQLGQDAVVLFYLGHDAVDLGAGGRRVAARLGRRGRRRLRRRVRLRRQFCGPGVHA